MKTFLQICLLLIVGGVSLLLTLNAYLKFCDEISPLVYRAVAIKTERKRMLGVVELIKKYAREYGVNQQLALNIAYCESHYRNVPNIRGERYGIGIYQFVRTTWNEQCEGDIWSEEDNIKCAIKLISRGELWRWKQSQKCWHNN